MLRVFFFFFLEKPVFCTTSVAGLRVYTTVHTFVHKFEKLRMYLHPNMTTHENYEWSCMAMNAESFPSTSICNKMYNENIFNFLKLIKLLFSSFEVNIYKRHTFWSVVIGGTLFFLQGGATNQIMVQRYQSLPDRKACYKYLLS